MFDVFWVLFGVVVLGGVLLASGDEISASPRNIAIYTTLFEQNCNNLKMAALAETCSYFFLLNTIINPYYHSCGFMTDIYPTISLSTHNGDDTPQTSVGTLSPNLPY